MTLTRPDGTASEGEASTGEDSEPSGDASPGLGDVAPIQRVVRPQRQQRKQRHRKLLGLQIASSVAFVALLVALVFFGYSSVLKITGSSGMDVTDPNAPNYVAEVRPTSVTLAVLTAEDGTLGAAALITRPEGRDAATLVPIAPSLLLRETETSPVTWVAKLYDSEDVDVLASRLGIDLGFGITEAVSVPLSQLTQIAEAVGPITVDNPDYVLAGTSDEDSVVQYESGELTLQPEEVAEFMAFEGYSEELSNWVIRSQVVWAALLQGLDADGTAVEDVTRADGDVADPTLGELVAPVVSPDVVFDSLPIERLPLNIAAGGVINYIDQAAMPTWTGAEVPFPTSAFPGQRAAVKLLNGTSDSGAAEALAPKIVEADGEVALIGNASSFDVPTTTVEYFAQEAQAAAEQIALALGAQVSQVDEEIGSVDVVVTVGEDAAT